LRTITSVRAGFWFTPLLSGRDPFSSPTFFTLPRHSCGTAVKLKLKHEDYAGLEGCYLLLKPKQARPDGTDCIDAEIKTCCRLAALLDVPLVRAVQNVVPVGVTTGDRIERSPEWTSGRCLSADRAGPYSRSEVSGIGRGKLVERESVCPLLLPSCSRISVWSFPLGVPSFSLRSRWLRLSAPALLFPARLFLSHRVISVGWL
jgi:hypothetical protein